MADKLSVTRRSANMRRIRSKETQPEIFVRKLIHNLGIRFRLHARELPGKPDIVRRPQRQAIFVHGCFWHQHPKKKCLDARPPKSNKAYWGPKLARNAARDRRVHRELVREGWRILVIWECETRKPERLARKVRRFFGLSG